MDVHAHHMSQSRAAGATRSPEPMSVKTDVDNSNNYYMIPGQQKLPVSGLQQSFYPSPLSAVSSQQQFQSPTMSQTLWASPRSSVDEFDNYSYQGPAPTSYHAASMSPRTWSPTVQTPPPAQFETPFHHQDEEYDGLNGDQMVSPEGMQPEPFMGYGAACYQSAHPSGSQPDSMRYASPPAVEASAAPIFTASPAPMEQQQEFKDESGMCGDLKTSPSPPRVESSMQVEQQQQQQPSEASRDNGEPYAQLIWKALKARDNRAMTLQQLYQWFLDNTDKPARAGNGGWRNSIRHNLSMNEAFWKREQTVDTYRSTSTGVVPPTSNERKPTEWFLRPEFEDRVMPTTHYRDVPRNSGRRSKAGAAGSRNRRVYHSSPEFPSRSVPARALSGRRGGRATTRSRNAARNLRLRPDDSAAASMAAAQHQHQHQWPGGFAAQQQHNLDAFRHLPYTQQTAEYAGVAMGPVTRLEDTRTRNRNASASFRARAEAVRRQQQEEALRQQQHEMLRTASPGIPVPHHHQHQPYHFASYPMPDVYQQHPEAVQPQQPQMQPHGDNSSVFYGWGNSASHGL